MTDSAIQDLLVAASEFFKLDIHSSSRTLEHIQARAIVYSIFRDCNLMTYQEIAKIFDKNHATMMHAIKELPYMIKQQPELEDKKIKLLEIWTSEYALFDSRERAQKIKNLQDRIFLLNLEVTLLSKQVNRLQNVND